jgi:hypothetical protein
MLAGCLRNVVIWNKESNSQYAVYSYTDHCYVLDCTGMSLLALEHHDVLYFALSN